MSNPRKRRDGRAFRTQWFVIATVLAAVVLAIVHLSPARHERPLITVYMNPECASCLRWMSHLNASGFRTQLGAPSEWMTSREGVRLPPGFSASHHAIVQGLFIAGYVPAGDIHRALRSPKRDSIRGLIVPGAPRGAPGVDAALKESYVVFAMDANGLLRPWATHNHFVH